MNGFLISEIAAKRSWNCTIANGKQSGMYCFFVNYTLLDHFIDCLQLISDLQRRIATFDCQLRKEQATSRRFQTATEKLLQFVEVYSQNNT